MNKVRSISALVVAVILATALLPVAEAEAQQGSKGRPAFGSSNRNVQHPFVGQRIRTLPQGNRSIRVNRQSYRYFNGSFYRPAPGGLFVVVQAPLGARVNALPPGAISFGIGPRDYFYSNFNYYLWDRPSREYVVVEPPQGAPTALVAASESVSGDIFVYPNEGQSEEQRDRDRYECYLWAVDQTGFDPGAGEPASESAADYRRATSACLEGRGYTVK